MTVRRRPIYASDLRSLGEIPKEYPLFPVRPTEGLGQAQSHGWRQVSLPVKEHHQFLGGHFVSSGCGYSRPSTKTSALALFLEPLLDVGTVLHRQNRLG